MTLIIDFFRKSDSLKQYTRFQVKSKLPSHSIFSQLIYSLRVHFLSGGSNFILLGVSALSTRGIKPYDLS